MLNILLKIIEISGSIWMMRIPEAYESKKIKI